MSKLKSIKQLHSDSVRLRKEQYERGQEAMNCEMEIHKRRGEYLFKTLRKIGYIEKHFTICDNIQLDRRDANPSKCYLTVYKKERKDWSQDMKAYNLPISWLFTEDNSFIKEAKAIIKEQKRKRRIKNKIRKLQSTI